MRGTSYAFRRHRDVMPTRLYVCQRICVHVLLCPKYPYMRAFLHVGISYRSALDHHGYSPLWSYVRFYPMFYLSLIYGGILHMGISYMLALLFNTSAYHLSCGNGNMMQDDGCETLVPDQWD